MEKQKLGNRSKMGERHGPWLSHSLTHISDTAAAAAARECNIQDEKGGGLCSMSPQQAFPCSPIFIDIEFEFAFVSQVCGKKISPHRSKVDSTYVYLCIQ